MDETAPPAWPHRGHYLMIAIILTAIAVYGSLVPLHYTPLHWHEAVQRFKSIPYLSLGIGSRADWVSNILLFIPLGYCWLGALTVRQQRLGLTLLAMPLVVVLCTTLSVALEFTQLWFPPRTVSQNDIVAETLGALVGTGLWLAIGPTLTAWMASYTGTRRPKQQFDWLLQLYGFGFVLYAILPLDLTISVTELVQKYRQGKVVLLPFADVHREVVALYGLLRDVLTALPLGMWAATWHTSPQQPVRPLRVSVLVGGLLILSLEVAQLFVYSRYTSSTDGLTGLVGVLLGALVMQGWYGAGQHVAPPPAAGCDRPPYPWYWVVCVGLYSLFLVVVFCAPFDAIHDAHLIKARYQGFFRVPFAALYQGSEFNAVSEILKKGLFFAPLGGFFTLAILPLPLPPAGRRLLLGVSCLIAVGTAVLIEMLQVFLPPHVPDLTDVLLCTAGVALGMWITLRLCTPRGSHLPPAASDSKSALSGSTTAGVFDPGQDVEHRSSRCRWTNGTRG